MTGSGWEGCEGNENIDGKIKKSGGKERGGMNAPSCCGGSGILKNLKSSP